MIPDEIYWYRNKIKGSLAEAVCRMHFEAMGYVVETYGIEHKAPHFSSLRYQQGAGQSAYWRKFPADFTRQPDFIISRLDANNNREAVLVEVKYRDTFNVDGLKEELIGGYRGSSNLPVLLYVLVRKPEPRVMLLFNGNGRCFSHAGDRALLRSSVQIRRQREIEPC